MDEIEVGKLMSSVDTLAKAVDNLTEKVDHLESQMDRGKGVLVGAIIVAGGIGAAGGTAVHKLISFFGG